MRLLRLILPLLGAFVAAAAVAAPAPTIAGVDVEGTRFRVTMTDGQMRHSDKLVGAVLTMGLDGRLVRVRIDSVTPDPRASARDVWLHTLSMQMPDGSWRNPCKADPDGKHFAFPIAGRTTDGVLRAAEPGRFELVCSAGAQGKCARFGYLPWSVGADGKPLVDTYNACVRLFRGDYGGRDEPLTNNGMLIDFYDLQGIQNSDADPVLVFEAGWGPDGAVCVHHPRVKENVTLEQLEARYPQLRGRTGAICTEEFARAHGALVFNHSRP
ncbi:MAG: hypothetical protein JO055_12740 [Alphaproteobacteria bacterium]|nr:hypothetical protein [Alphaproteobacteria bacterium]